MIEQSDCPAWWKQPGQCYDMHGYPIYPGDLVRTFHFAGRRRRKHYLYHVIVFEFDSTRGHGYLRMVPAQSLEPTLAKQGGNPLLSDSLARECEIVAEATVGDWLTLEDRPRRSKL